MRKKYIRPSVELVRHISETPILAGSPGTGSSGIGGDGEQGVLPPAPCGILVVKNHVPVGVCGGAVAEVVVDQVEDVLRVLPAVVAGAAFGLRLDQLDLRP